MLDIVQRHHDIPVYLGDVTNEWDVLDILERSGITYIVQNALLRGYIEGTRAIIEAAIAASVCKLVYMSSTGIIFDSTDVMNVDKRVPYLEEPFDTYNDSKAQGEKVVLEANGKDGLLTVALRPAGVFGPKDSQIGGSRSLFNCTYNVNITHTILLAGGGLVPPPSYSSATLSEPRLDPEGATAKLSESLHHTLPPICATTKYHQTTQTLSSYVTPTPNTESILSMFNTPFDPRGLTDTIVHSRSDGQVFFITGGEAFGILDFTRVYNEYKQKPLHLKVQGKFSVYEELYYKWGEWVQYMRERMLTLQCSVKGNEMFDDEGWEVAWWILATTTGLDVDQQPRKIGSVIRWRRSTMGADPELDSSNFCFEFGRGNRYLRQMVIAIQESTSSFEQSTHRSKVLNQVEAWSLMSEGKEDAKVPFSVLIQGYSTAKYRVLSAKVKRIDRDGQFEAAHQYLASRLCPPDCEVEGQQLRSSELSACTHRSRRPINEGDVRMVKIMVNEDRQLEVAQ
ncbi:3-beta hydroxysteroid dehydrogenase/isomerase family-domain-containing protein [Pisolithus tinctorius]|nr:3-beta hydroxysteroid dehydrogenase/isomerase family-domain-containing protein [Pisolithus tinctorius]